MNEVIIDVREKNEFDAEHIEHSLHLPLSCFGTQAPGILRSLAGKKIIFMCLGGKRATQALQQSKALFTPGSLACQLEVFEGGILEWKKQGRPVVSSSRAPLPIMRQVLLVAGSLILLSATLALTLSHGFIWIAVLVGAGLTFAGATGFCPMAELLARMPWNR